MRRIVLLTFMFLSAAYADIPFRSFGASEAIGPPAVIFAGKVRETTKTTGVGEVVFTKLPGIPQIPSKFSGDIIAAVAAGSQNGGFDAAYTSGSDLNKTWGFLFNSGIPFGPTFEEYLAFLYGQGIILVQEALDPRGVVAFPIAGGSEQLSGYFQEPIGNIADRKGIGLAGLCAQPWTLRYLPPGETVLKIACQQLLDLRQVDKVRLNFIQAIPGSGSLIDAVTEGRLSGFEFATPLDDVSQLFTGLSNPATVGLRYVHTPGWHQQFLITWFVLRKDVWNSFSDGQKLLIKTIATENLIQSYAYNLRRQGAALQTILSTPGMIAVEWPARDLAILRVATGRMLDAKVKDNSLPANDRAMYVSMLDALRTYIRSNLRYRTTVQRLPP